MTLGRVVGTVVSTRKDERLQGFKLLVIRAVDPDGKQKGAYVVAVDTVDAGTGELVLVVSGSSARMATGCQDRPVDAAVVGIIDTIDLDSLELAGARARS
jgi:microcompartment protein CcmK/EutM